MAKKKRGPGRPPIGKYNIRLNLMIDELTKERLDWLSKDGKESKSKLIRTMTEVFFDMNTRSVFNKIFVLLEYKKLSGREIREFLKRKGIKPKLALVELKESAQSLRTSYLYENSKMKKELKKQYESTQRIIEALEEEE